MMRTVTFKSVLNGVLRRLGLDPDAENLPHDTVRAVTEHINTRLETAWHYWPWQELMVTEERAFRAFWDVAVDYKTGDEFYYAANQTYYSTIADAVAGTLPTDVTKFEVLEMRLYGNVPFVQAGKQEIGQVFGVYNTDPRETSKWAPGNIGFYQTEEGIGVGLAAGLPTVWMTFRRARPQFTSVPHAAGRIYVVGDVVYFPEVDAPGVDPVVTLPTGGDCYVVTGFTDDYPSVEIWALLPFPAMFEAYVKMGAYADALLELDDANLSAEKVQMRLAKARSSDATAEQMLALQARHQIEQGDRAHYRRFTRPELKGWSCAA